MDVAEILEKSCVPSEKVDAPIPPAAPPIGGADEAPAVEASAE